MNKMESTKRDIESYRARPDNMKSQFIIFVLNNTTIEEYYEFKKELGGGDVNKVGTLQTPLLQFAEKYFQIALKRSSEKLYSGKEVIELCRSAFYQIIDGLPYNTTIFEEWLKSKNLINGDEG